MTFSHFLQKLSIRSKTKLQCADFSGHKDEYERARLWIKEMCARTGCPEEYVRVISGNHDVTRSAVNSSGLALGSSWRRDFVAKTYEPAVEDLAIVSRALKLVDATQNSAWVPAFAQATNVDAAANITPCVLAYQVYLEVLLCKAWEALRVAFLLMALAHLT